jgi:hypothetical protein
VAAFELLAEAAGGADDIASFCADTASQCDGTLYCRTHVRILLTALVSGYPGGWTTPTSSLRQCALAGLSCRCQTLAPDRAQLGEMGRLDQQRLSDEHPQPDGRRDLMRRVAAFVAPVAVDAGSVADDPVSLDVADAIYQAFGDLDADGGLTRGELLAACADVCDQATFDNRFNAFEKLGMLLGVRDKAHQVRYLFNPTSAAALLVFERLAQAGGVQEIMTLLDRTRAGLRSGVAGRQQVEANLTRARRAFAVYADHLLRMVRLSPLEELLAERRHHRDTETLLADARDLVALVADRFPELTPAGQRLIAEALRYSAAVAAFIDRLLDEASARRDFSMLDAEQYLTAALRASRDELAEVFARTVFDPPSLLVTPDMVVRAVEEVRPRAARRRPPRPDDRPPGPDPIDQARQRTEAARQRRLRAAEDLLQGADEADVTSRLRAAGWPGAAMMVAALLVAAADEQLPYLVELRDAVLVDADAAVTHVTPMTLRRRRGAEEQAPRPEQEERVDG